MDDNYPFPIICGTEFLERVHDSYMPSGGKSDFSDFGSGGLLPLCLAIWNDGCR